MADARVIRDHHKRTIGRLVERYREDDRYVALLIGGSVAKGWAMDNSDVDFMLVAREDVYRDCVEKGELAFYERALCDYPDGYIDAKVISASFMKEVADKGSEPARSAFVDAIVGFSRLPDLPELLRRIVLYPEKEREAKIRTFFSQVLLLGGFFVREAVKREDDYLLVQATSSLVLFGSRLILAHNRVLYPYHKWLMRQLERTPDKPVGFMDLTRSLLSRPGVEPAEAYVKALSGFRDWGVSYPEAVAQFVQDSEWNWRDGHPPISDW